MVNDPTEELLREKIHNLQGEIHYQDEEVDRYVKILTTAQNKKRVAIDRKERFTKDLEIIMAARGEGKKT